MALPVDDYFLWIIRLVAAQCKCCFKFVICLIDFYHGLIFYL